MPAIYNPIFFKYGLGCTFPGCQGRQEVEQATSAGWTLGYKIPEDTSNPEVGKCPMCRRYSMVVTRAPDPVEPEKPIGWAKVPTS